MDTKTGHVVEDADGVSVAVLDRSVDGAGVANAMTKGRVPWCILAPPASGNVYLSLHSSMPARVD